MVGRRNGTISPFICSALDSSNNLQRKFNTGSSCHQELRQAPLLLTLEADYKGNLLAGEVLLVPLGPGVLSVHDLPPCPGLLGNHQVGLTCDSQEVEVLCCARWEEPYGHCWEAPDGHQVVLCGRSEVLYDREVVLCDPSCPCGRFQWFCGR